jgi:hypothetical protein
MKVNPQLLFSDTAPGIEINTNPNIIFPDGSSLILLRLRPG